MKLTDLFKKKKMELQAPEDPYVKIDWGKVTVKNSTPFIFPLTRGFVIKVYDGDTITVATLLPSDVTKTVYNLQVRLNGIDCPEIKSKDSDEKECAIIARDKLSGLIFNKHVTFKNIGHEKYGRILADIYVNDIFVNEWMIKEKLAVEYDGATKKSPNWKEYFKK